jgi:hypothetical protein
VAASTDQLALAPDPFLEALLAALGERVEPLLHLAPPPVEDDVEDEVVRLFDDALDVGRPGVAAALAAAVAALAEAWTLEDVEAALRRSGHLEELLEGERGVEAWAAFRAAFRDAYEGEHDADGRRLRYDAPVVLTWLAASDAASHVAPSVHRSWWRADRFADEAVSWVDRVGANRLTGAVEATKDGVREVLRYAFVNRRGDHDWVARVLELLDGEDGLRLGLDARRAEWLARFATDLDASVPAARRTQLVERRYQQLLGQRYATVAQTEVMQVANAAQARTWELAVQEGEVDDRLWVLAWVARAMACKRCFAMVGATREISGGVFVSDGSGPYGVEAVEVPDLHPNGWCFMQPRLRSEVPAPRAA